MKEPKQLEFDFGEDSSGYIRYDNGRIEAVDKYIIRYTTPEGEVIYYHFDGKKWSVWGAVNNGA